MDGMNPQQQQPQQQEPYGASLLRRVHEDMAMLCMEYDELCAPLDNPEVRQHMTELLKTIMKLGVSGSEKCFKKCYKDLQPLGGAQPDQAPPDDGDNETPQEEFVEEEVKEELQEEKPREDKGIKIASKSLYVIGEREGKKFLVPVKVKRMQRKDADTLYDHGVGASSDPRDYPTTDEVVEGMGYKMGGCKCGVTPCKCMKGFVGDEQWVDEEREEPDHLDNIPGDLEWMNEEGAESQFGGDLGWIEHEQGEPQHQLSPEDLAQLKQVLQYLLGVQNAESLSEEEALKAFHYHKKLEGALRK